MRLQGSGFRTGASRLEGLGVLGVSGSQLLMKVQSVEVTDCVLIWVPTGVLRNTKATDSFWVEAYQLKTDIYNA